jgi:hypothetical protein
MGKQVTLLFDAPARVAGEKPPDDLLALAL